MSDTMARRSMSMTQDIQHEARIAQAWKSGQVVILAMLGEGPSAGKLIACVTPRSTFTKGCIRRAGKMLRSKEPLDSLRTAIRREVLRGAAGLSPQTDKDLMNDLAILMAVKLAGGGEACLEGTGLFSLLLEVDPDDSKPWFERGFLSKMDSLVATPIEV